MLIFFVFLLIIGLSLILNSIFYPIPISDTGNVRYSSIPFMTLTLILVNALVFIFFQAFDYYQGINMINAGDMDGVHRLYHYVQTVWTYGYRGIFLRDGLSIGAFSTFTSMFMHGDFDHLFYNMIFLWTFGRRVEDACGPWRFL